ncbi:MAG: hypothetical protein KBH86_08450 [Syntrophorhabdus sp.]|nr:hypothetical protein [Syntrophorhabdus sp.]
MRNYIIDFLKRELIGPDPVSPYIQPNGEEILWNEPPRLRYGAGILFPQNSAIPEIDSTDEAEKEMFEALKTTEDPAVLNEVSDNAGISFPKSVEDDLEANDDAVSLANAFLPSAMGFSCFLNIPKSGFRVSINAGRYKMGDAIIMDQEGNPVSLRGYLREPLDCEIIIERQDIPNGKIRSKSFEICKNNEPTGLLINVRSRTPDRDLGETNQLYTFTLINSLVSSGSHIDNENCFFQTGFKIRTTDGSACFLPYPSVFRASEHPDEKSQRLLYRNQRTFAIGHGCSPCWTEQQDLATEIWTEIIPVFEMKAIVPVRLAGIELKMFDLSDHGKPEQLNPILLGLAHRYEAWIDLQVVFAEEQLSGEFQTVALSHVENCRQCLSRIREGIDLLQGDETVRKAFLLMNRAMLLQQLRYGLRLREWRVGKDKSLEIERIEYPDARRPETWPDWSPSEKINKRYGSWYPFQIAFILMNLRSIAFAESSDRKIVDVIWFPTGGGKTEAYLGLTAFTIFLRRLRNTADSGTAVLMRYTLRLLTAQQFQRASSLICACEIIRKEKERELGAKRIEVGLWVGDGLTPNKRSGAVAAFRKMTQGRTKENPFVVLKCPWCGAQMGNVKEDRQNRVQGYRLSRNPSTVVFQCHNPDCDFSSDSFRLPLIVIDEDIYETPPALLIGTVDKFAMLPWNTEARNIVGLRNGTKVASPELIIQDELHLISGPLGSMVGHYETILSELCRDSRHGDGTYPKIIASTATISRAAEQCHALYGCGKDSVFLFPPQCINAGESFFACVDTQAKGRIYAGVHASGLPSHATAQVRMLSALLQAVKSAPAADERSRNPYWTLLNYFNSLRELGHAATLVSADIVEYLNAMWIRKGIRKTGNADPRRFIHRTIELTSRIQNTEVPQCLQELEIDYPGGKGALPVDICLATNMISVGVDVQRLGLMTVIGQPKTTSEYIQATSRVGRSKKGPGLVVVLYNTTKPRDRSHYEHFLSYHSTIYSQVEPMSVTPFSSPVRERALHALLVTYVRYFGNPQNRACPQPFPENSLLDKFKALLSSRIETIDPGELELSLRLLDERIREWKDSFPPRYGGFGASPERPLMYPAGMTPNEEWEGVSWPTPTSMRNVDVSCEAGLIRRYEGEN